MHADAGEQRKQRAKDEADPTDDVEHTDATVSIEVRCADNYDLSLELYTAEQRTDLLARALGADVSVHFVSETALQ